MAVDMFLKLETVDGESTKAAHEDEIDLLSFSFGATQTGTSHSGGGSGAGKVSIQDLTITKHVDKASPVLFALCCSGKHVKSALLTVRKASGDSPLEYLKLKLEHVLITHFQTHGNEGAELITESVSMNFKAVGMIYTPQLDDGSGGPEVTGGWSVRNNEPWEP